MSADADQNTISATGTVAVSVRHRNWTIRITEDWESCKTAWQSLEHRSPASPFHAYVWASKWYEIARRSNAAKPLVVTGYYAEDSAPSVLLALCMTKQFGLRIISAADKGVSDYFKPLICSKMANNLPGSALSDFFNSLPDALPDHDLITLSRLDPDGLPIRASDWSEANIRLAPVGTWSFGLGGKTSDNIEDQLSPKLRKTLRSKIRAMTQNLNRRVEHHWPLTDTGILQDVLKLQQRRLDSTDRRSLFLHSPWRDQYKEVVSAHDAGTHMAATLLYDGAVLTAASIGLVTGQSFVGLVLAMRNGDADRYSPGKQVLLEAIKKAQQEGVEVFELSIGDQEYKRRFGCKRRPLYTVVLPATLKGRIAWCGWRARYAVRNLTTASTASPGP